MAISLPIAITALLSMPAASPASFHEMLIREVFTAGLSGGSYVELQMRSNGQNFVAGHKVVTYNTDGSVAHTFSIPSHVAKGESQRTVLIAGNGYSGPTADATDSGLDLPPTGGAVCFTEGSPPDCVSWGNFTGNNSLPAPKAGNPASPTGVTAGKALNRSIAAGCPTLLELGDDTNDSAADFSEQTPNPRNNASAIVEKACVAPTAEIKTKPANPTKETSASFTYESNPPGASFECSLDSSFEFSSCEASGKTYAGPLADGNHTFRVRAKDVNGTGVPAAYTWKVDTVDPTVEIDTEPPAQSPGNIVTFTFHPSETGSQLQCTLNKGAASDAFVPCSSPKSYEGLLDDTYTFKVKATDLAGNEGQPTPYTWEVDNSLNDEEPPLTTIKSGPPDPSTSSIASFTYESNEPASTFECALDAAGFTGCPASGVTYTGLANGPHTFQVRATDGFGNTDKSPAGYSWTVFVIPVAVVPTPIGLARVPTLAPFETTITGKPGPKTRDRTPTFRFKSNISSLSFECKLDKGAFRTCSSPFTTKTLAFGPHIFRVRAKAGSRTEPTPASANFKVVKSKKKGHR